MMKYYKNGKSIIATIGNLNMPEITKEEYEAESRALEEKREANAEKEYWATIDYDEAVNNKIRERYSVSQEFAVLRQKEEKPEEYASYYAYCEESKAFVKSKKGVI